MACGNGTERGQHPLEIFGPDWLEVGLDGTPPTPPLGSSDRSAREEQ